MPYVVFFPLLGISSETRMSSNILRVVHKFDCHRAVPPVLASLRCFRSVVGAAGQKERIMRFTVATLLIGLACALPASAQSPFVSRDQAVSPLNVTTEFSSSVGAECDGGEGLVVQLQYTGAQPLRG